MIDVCTHYRHVIIGAYGGQSICGNQEIAWVDHSEDFVIFQKKGKKFSIPNRAVNDECALSNVGKYDIVFFDTFFP